MDPLSLIKVLWRYRWFALPAVVLALLMTGYVVFFGPRTYESSAIYVITTPDMPTDRELQHDKRLARLNSNNPYLHAADSALIVHVLVAKMTAQSTGLDLKSAGLSPDFTVAESPATAMAVVVTSYADTPEMAAATRQWLLDDLGQELNDLQKVKGADDRYLFTALPVDIAPLAVEKISSRLRYVIVVLGAGAILVMGVVSLAAAVDGQRRAAPKVEDNALPSATEIQLAHALQALSAVRLDQTPRTKNGVMQTSGHPLEQPAETGSTEQSTAEDTPTVVRPGGRDRAGGKVVAEASSQMPSSSASEQALAKNTEPATAGPLERPTQVSSADLSTIEEWWDF